jgi:tetratricopeptide (TPR) repeat protein
VGDLLVATGKFDAARQFYGQLEKSPFPDYKARAGVALGKSMVAEGKYPEALKQFEAVLALPAGKGSGADAQRLAATLGKAACLAQSGKPDDGIKLVQDVIAGADAEDAPLMAQAYVTLGNCYLKKPDSQKQALLAYLHVDVLYFSQPQAHAEALKHLAILWNELNKPERASQVQQTLKDRYGGGAQ